jgi:hypothetical protein
MDVFQHGQTWNDKKDCRLLSAFAIIQNCAAWYTARPLLLSKNGNRAIPLSGVGKSPIKENTMVCCFCYCQ